MAVQSLKLLLGKSKISLNYVAINNPLPMRNASLTSSQSVIIPCLSVT